MAKKKKNKILKIVGFTFLVLLGLLIALPLFLEGKIADIIKNKVNQNINATLDFDDANLSLLKSFPNANVDLKAVSLVNKAPFTGDTLFSAGHIELDMSIKELFKSAEEPIAIKKLSLDKAKIHIKVDEEANANYDIAIEEEMATSQTNEESTNFNLDLQSYSITNSSVVYDDFSTGMHLVVSEMNHTGTGDLSLEDSKLQTQTNALVSFELDSVKYLNKNKVALKALLGIDLNQNKYSFLENEALVNQLPLVFDGFVKVNENSQEVDISFKTPSSDFKNFLAVIPEAYAKNIENVETSGNFEVDGTFKGIVDDTHIPTFTIKLNSTNASFKYPDLPKAVKNVFIDVKVNNETGITEDTYVNVDRLSFQIDNDKFNLTSKIRDLLGNTKVNLHADGSINLNNLSKAYPVPADLDLSGLLTADLTTAFDMASVENKKYENTQTSGSARLQNFHYESAELKQPLDIEDANLSFNPKTVTLNSFTGKTGNSDFKANGTITNLLGYMFNNEDIEGNFKLQSNTFSINDFMVTESEENLPSSNEEEDTTVANERITIPSFLNATVDATAQNVVYDNLNLKNVNGRLRIKDQVATLENLTSELFDGKMSVNGAVSTKEATSTFDLNLGIDGFKISESFKAIEMFKVLAPVANALEGKLNSTVKFSGNLKDDLTVNLASLSGDLLAELLSTEITAANKPMLNALDSKLDFIDFTKLDLKDIKTVLQFNDGKVNVKPFSLKYKDIIINVSGSHTFDAQLQYEAVLDVPAKYLGAEVNKLIGQIDDETIENLTVPITAAIGGNYTSPSVSTDLTSGVKQLTNQLVEIQKQKLKDKGKEKAQDLLNNLIKADKDSTFTSAETSDTKIEDVVGGILNGTKNDTIQKDSVSKKDNKVKDAATSILGGLLGKKKKDSTN
ncbi:hypothetical protein GCM10011414_24760 [Croceivirga lutea]|uniref:AsmA-like C-terminal region-containing protein n=1 Tax=Croceivirga lutea TaxID=1775167 RepID=UPI00163B31DE|nr:AsmA-like C-terminal region-containing protein [Croceivirga lutea]GGG54080.1 hypothetical protein GCM10011414_24760 [Croceivirga lutea]